MVRRFVGSFLLVLCSILTLADDSENLACRNDPRVVGKCFRVHGRLSNWNGNPTGRIWVFGTKRILGVRDDTQLPKALADRLGDFDDVTTGEFEVCPLTHERKGKMRIVCVAAVSNFKVTKRKR